MHILQPKHSILKKDEVEKLLSKLNISLAQLPKINSDDKALPEGCEVGEVVKIERRDREGKLNTYYRVIV